MIGVGVVVLDYEVEVMYEDGEVMKERGFGFLRYGIILFILDVYIWIVI